MCGQHWWSSISTQAMGSGPGFLISGSFSIGWGMGYFLWPWLWFSSPRASR